MARTTADPGDLVLREVVSFPHQLVIWLSLDRLEPFWMSVPSASAAWPNLRTAAQKALQGWHSQGGPDAPENWFWAMLSVEATPETVTTMRSLFNALQRLQSTPDIGFWRAWVSQNQHCSYVPGMDRGRVDDLMKAFRKLIAEGDAAWVKLQAAIKSMPLSDWDLHIHTAYGYCTEQTGQLAESVLMAGLSRLKADILFNLFLAQHVLALPRKDQRHLLEAVREEWAELWSDDDTGLVPLLPAQRKSAQNASQIKPAAEVVVWS